MKKLALSALGMMLAGSAFAAPDWSKVPPKKITVFYPGQSGIEWILTKNDHSAANQILEKNRGCTYCHDEEAPDIGKKVVEGKPAGNQRQPLEPAPPKGKPGFIPVTVQAAHDDKKLYLRFEWDATAGGGQKQDQKNEVKLAVMMGETGKVEGGKQNGCWMTCHMDARTMPDAQDDAAKKSPKAKALGWSEGATKYLKESRSAIEMTKKPRGGWDRLKSDAEIDAALKDGKFFDLIQYRSGKGEKAIDGYVLDARYMDGGKSLVKAEGGKQGGKWVVTFERNLAGMGKGDITIAEGKTYDLGFAIHDDYSNARYHHVSLGYALGLDNPKAEINAVKQ